MLLEISKHLGLHSSVCMLKVLFEISAVSHCHWPPTPHSSWSTSRGHKWATTGDLFLILTKSVLLDCFLEFLTLKFTFYINGVLETCILSPRRSTTRAHAHWTHSLPCTLFLRHTWWTSALHGVFFDQKLKVALFNFTPLIFLQAKAKKVITHSAGVREHLDT